MAKSGHIRVGIGGWRYEAWRKTFYPKEVTQANELEYASRQVTAIEINSTFYRLQQPHVFAKWYTATPADFMFTIKAPRFIVQRKILAESAASVERFIASGIASLKTKLGPILWQLAPTHHFDPADLDEFLQLLPKKIEQYPLRHALNVRHASFKNPQFVALAQAHDVAIVFEDDDEYPGFADLTTSFVYARLRRTVATQPTGYSKADLKKWADRAYAWSQGQAPKGLPYIQQPGALPPTSHDVFMFFINGAKERAPAAAQQLIKNLKAITSK